MTHDELCPVTSCIGPVCKGNDCTCQCDFIAKVRANERAKSVEYLTPIMGFGRPVSPGFKRDLLRVLEGKGHEPC